MLTQQGATRILKDYDANGVTPLSFMIQFKNHMIPIRLPANTEKVRLMLNAQVDKRAIPKKFYNNIEQARRIMWISVK